MTFIEAVDEDVTLGRRLWLYAKTIEAEPNSRDWWVQIAQAARVAMDEGLMAEAAALVEKELGGTEVSDQKLEVTSHEHGPESGRPQDFNEPTSAQAIAPEGIGPRAAAHRTICSQRALFAQPVVLDRRFRPDTYGYTAEDFHRDYPHADTRFVLESFFSHHISKGDTSRNWLEKFWSYAAKANQIAQSEALTKTSTDSMGQPLDPSERARRVQVARQHERDNNAYIDQQIAAEAAQRESKQP